MSAIIALVFRMLNVGDYLNDHVDHIPGINIRTLFGSR